MTIRYLLVLTCSVLLIGCASGDVDVEAERASLLATDAAWSNSAGDLEAFLSYFTDDARFLAPDGPQATGSEEIRESFTALATLPGFTLTWRANFADVASSGDLGYTVGTFELMVDGPDGAPATRTGTYATIWRKQSDGEWRVVADIPNFDSPAG